jgi:hypothetical protein
VTKSRMTTPRKLPKAIKTGPIARIAAVALAALAIATPLVLAATPARAICTFPDGVPYECQDWIPTNKAVPPPLGVTGGPGGLDSKFLESLAKYKISTADGDNGVLITAGKAISHNLDTGATGAQEVTEILKGSKLRPDQAEAFVASAVGIYCPYHGNGHDLLGPSG